MKSSHRWITVATIQVVKIAEKVRNREILWWWVAIAFFGVGDLLTTDIAIESGTVGEANPIVRHLLDAFGFGGFVALKILAFALSYGVWRAVGRPNNVGVPFALSAIGIAFSLWNLIIAVGVPAG